MAIDSTFQAVLAAMGSFLMITLILAAIIIICQSRKAKHSPDRDRHRSITASSRLTSIAAGVDESASFDPSLQVSMAEIVVATKNFSTDLIVGDGSFGLVYKAKLNNGLTVAIKKLDPDAFQGFREFRAEMETLGQLRHRNLGNLDIWLHDSSSSTEQTLSLPLSWATRKKIVKGVANGLDYLHGLEKPIIHRDIKASNVLLDSEFEARIADFGLARTIDSSHSHVSTQVAGTMGYMPPEYKAGFTLATVKADVYSFGTLMLESAMGKRPNLPMAFDGVEMGFVEWARKMVAQNREMEMVDVNISREGLVECDVKEYFRIACLCTHEYPRERPAMKDVVHLLMQIC
ncbi:hypothetical protein G4B88_008371 [Cannabis sativa]|uniref:Protein kinase domain-containing protein n=1 Tax=Cannabis sativa TaxID=3483 RepID=A0A7J6F5L3_CANSA|nr:hypothetical protein G4B88_008371 [Cannabis sativa]